jgi:hypothetical protein
MKKYIVAKIHNNSLGNVTVVDNIEDAKNLVKKLFKKQFRRHTDNFENDELDDMLEIRNEEDYDNIYTFSIADIA